ncbi:branched-chain amino acid transaminase [Candidatus Woesearchaeota archaeon]|nr:branched-chain amino acid transaminase [Candidatus Woesearchaeota archaeon]
MEKTEKIWMDGKLVAWEDAKIHVLTHTLHYGSGVFEGIRFYETDKGPAIFRLHDHMARLFHSASTLEMKVPFSIKELEKAVVETVKANKVKAGYIRPLVYYGYGKMGLYPHGAPVNVCIAVWPWGAYLGHDAVKVKVSSFLRVHPKSFIADAKVCGSYVNSINASLEAKREGFDEALMLDYRNFVSEGPGENIFMVKGGKLLTPSLGSILPGITRNSILQIAKDEKIGTVEKDISLEELKNADELFYTGTAAEVTGIAQIDHTTIGNGKAGPITEKLKKMYLDSVHGKNKKYEQWLTYC